MPARRLVALLLSVLMAAPFAAIAPCSGRDAASGGGPAEVACCGPLCACGDECPCRASAPAVPDSPEPIAPAAAAERLLAWEVDPPERPAALRPRPHRAMPDREAVPAAGGREVLLRKRVLRT